MKILIICSANSCRSQMAEAFFKSLDKNLIVKSAGTEPADSIHPLTVKAMAEIGIDISQSTTKNINQLITQDWDYVITVCDMANTTCPAFIGKVKNSIFLRFEDPLAYKGDDEFLLQLVRQTREHIKIEITEFYNEFIKIKQT